MYKNFNKQSYTKSWQAKLWFLDSTPNFNNIINL